MKWMKDPLAGFISRCGARMGKFTALLVTIAMLAGTTGAGATAFADETVTDGGNVAVESAASQPESTQQSDAENAVGSDVADIAGQDVAGQSAPAKIARMLWRMAMRARQPMTAKPAMRTMLTTMATLLKMPTMPTRTVRMTPTRMPRRLKTATITTRMMLPKTMPTPTNTSCAIASPSIAKP